jgi:hypothetical protein
MNVSDDWRMEEEVMLRRYQINCHKNRKKKIDVTLKIITGYFCLEKKMWFG